MRSYVNTRPVQEHSANRPSCQVSVSVKPCYRCGALHPQVNRSFKNSQWHFYGKTGHMAKVCKSKATKQKQTLIDSLTEDKASDEISSAYSFFLILSALTILSTQFTSPLMAMTFQWKQTSGLLSV